MMDLNDVKKFELVGNEQYVLLADAEKLVSTLHAKIHELENSNLELLGDARRYRYLKTHAHKIEWHPKDVNHNRTHNRPNFDVDVDWSIRLTQGFGFVSWLDGLPPLSVGKNVSENDQEQQP